MKILICGSRGIPARYGGFESLAQALAENFNNHEHEAVVTGFSNEIGVPVLNQVSGSISYQIPVRGPRFVQNFLCTWKATRDLDANQHFDAAIVLNDVNYFIARKYRKMGVRTVLHLDGAEARRSSLPIIGKFAHWFFRRLAVKSGIPLVVDSVVIKKDMRLNSQKVAVISYAPHIDEAKKPQYENLNLEHNGYFIVIARLVGENQILELIDGYISSGRDEQLFIIGLGTGSKKYEMRVINAAQYDENIHVLPKNYDRAEINWLLQNAKGYIHGHSVGGTNPILVDARLHAQLIFSHDNPYNRENSGHKEHFWSNDDQLTKLLKDIDLLEVNTDANDYGLDSWDTIALQYLELLTKRD